MNKKKITQLFLGLVLTVAGLSLTISSQNSKPYSTSIKKIESFEKDSTRYIRVAVLFENNTQDTLHIFSMSCATLHSIYRFNNKTLEWGDPTGCLSNLPEILALPPLLSRHDTLIFALKRGYELPVSFKVGFVITDYKGHDYSAIIMGKTNYQHEIWSNSLTWDE